MSAPDSERSLRLDGAEPVRHLMDQWTEGFAQVLETMTDQKPAVRWHASSGGLAEVLGATEAAELLWWGQHFQISAATSAWVAAPPGVWEYVGRLTLQVAGVENADPAEVKSTWFEIVGQSLAGVSRAISSILGREVGAAPGAERPPESDLHEWASVSISFGETPLPGFLLALSPSLTEAIAAPPRQPAPPAPASAASPPPEGSRTMDLLLDVDLSVSISFGRAELPMKDVLKLTTGSIVELNRSVNEPVEVLVNRCLIARGEVVVVEGNYGVRIQEIASRQDRLRSIR